MLTRTLLLFVASFVLVLGAAPAQGKIFKPDAFERATKVDENGLIQWDVHKEVKCPNCNGTGKHKCTTCERYPDEAKKCRDCGRSEKREAVCQACAGTGKFLDPLEKALCPGCMGAGGILCISCGGTGLIKVAEGKFGDCICCRGEGFFECPICEGARTAEVAKLKPSLAEAPSKVLKKALEVTDAALAAITAFLPTAANTRKEVKELAKIVKDAEKIFPPFKEHPKLVKQYMKWTYAGSNYQGQKEREAESLKRLKQPVEYYLQHQKHMMELALKRAEANEKLLEEQKGK